MASAGLWRYFSQAALPELLPSWAFPVFAPLRKQARHDEAPKREETEPRTAIPIEDVEAVIESERHGQVVNERHTKGVAYK